MPEESAAQNTEALTSTTENVPESVLNQAVQTVSSEKKEIENAGHHWLSHLEEDLIKEFHWITVDETKKILDWIAARTEKKS